ncbi:MAG: hypothetical protein U5J98_10675 [Halobacteriales archaeon]|nr:hypothetical protein [Halobacteriales archaeon]
MGSRSRSSVSPVVDFPQPDSPTSPSVSPALDVEVDAVDRLDARRLPAQQLVDQRVALEVVLREPLDAEQRLAHADSSSK